MASSSSLTSTLKYSPLRQHYLGSSSRRSGTIDSLNHASTIKMITINHSNTSKMIIKSVLHLPSLPASTTPPQEPIIRLPNHPAGLDTLTSSTTTKTEPNLGFLGTKPTPPDQNQDKDDEIIASKMYAVLETISDRIEMHKNICEQRNNWNTLLFNSVNMITLSATLTACIASAAATSTPDASALLAMKISSTLLFSSATGLLALMNKIQPSQMVEEQRNAVRLFNQLQTRIQTTMVPRRAGYHHLTEDDVATAIESVLAIDRAYPLPLLGAMLDKFPEKFEPACWWPMKNANKSTNADNKSINIFKTSAEGGRQKNDCCNGWSEGLEEDLREVVEVIRKKDVEDYVRLGSKALNLSKGLAVAGPLLTGLGAVGAAFVGSTQPWAVVTAAVCGSLASFVNTVAHGGQVGMVLEMYRNCAGSYRLMEETVEATLGESRVRRRENGKVFELKMALGLGRSLSELRDLAARSRRDSNEEFASKLY